MTTKKQRFYLDLMERTLWTAVQAALGFWIDYSASGDVTWRGVAYAAGFAVAKALVAKNLPGTAKSSASTLPAHLDPPQHTPMQVEAMLLAIKEYTNQRKAGHH